MIDFGHLGDVGGLGALFVAASYWTRRQLLREIRKHKELQDGSTITAPISHRLISQLGGRIDELEATVDRYERYFEEHDRRIQATERFVVATKRSS